MGAWSPTAVEVFMARRTTGAARHADAGRFMSFPPVGAGDPWQETTLYTFTGGSDGASPVAALWRDKLGDLYGTTLGGNHSAGTVFKLVPPAGLGEVWTLVVLHSFGSPAGAATGSSSALTMLEGVLYGTTSTGGVGSNLGRVFSVVP
jgi:hypothetical protein